MGTSSENSMHFTQTEQQHIRGITVTRKGERTFSTSISIDTHAEGKDARSEALSLVYVKALLSGAGKYSREAFLDSVSLLGGSLGVSISQGVLTIGVTSLDTNASKLFELVRTMLKEPTFAPKEIARIKELLRNELHESKEDAKSESVRIFTNTLYKALDRRFSASPDELAAEVSKVAKKDLERFHTYATSGIWVFTLVAEDTLALKIQKDLLKLRSAFLSGSRAAAPHAQRAIKKREVVLSSIPSKQNIEFSIGAPLPLSITDPEYYPFLFGLQVLGKWGGFTGRLMSTVREKEGLTYGIYARTETVRNDEMGYWRIMTFFSPDKALQGLTSTLREIQLICEKGITEGEYERFKTIIATNEALLRDSILRTASDIHSYQLKGLSVAQLQEHKKKLTQVTRAEVNEALKKYMRPDALVIAGAGPTSAIQKEIKALTHLAKEGK